MSVLCFVMLAHEGAEHVADVAKIIADADPTCFVIIHYDANAAESEYQRLRALCDQFPQIRFVEERVDCGWGQFGLVEGVVNSLRYIDSQNVEYTHAYLVSGSCMPIRPLAELRLLLDDHPETEYIQSFDKSWIVGGLKEDRYQRRFRYNYQKQRQLFEMSLFLQRRFGKKRRFPKGLEPRFGSQWWCLTRRTCSEIIGWIDANRKDYEFFRWTWIPDESFFQTLVYKIVGAEKIAARILTHYQFNSAGKPVVFHNGHEEHLKGLDFFFARKVSPTALALRAELKRIAAKPQDERPTVRDGSAGAARLACPGIVREQVLSVRPGKIFDDSQIYRVWPSSMKESMQSFAVLYGPPDVTKAAASKLRDRDGLTVVGRLFRSDEVDFGPDVSSFSGLQRNDVAIRDVDPALYLSRVLKRCGGFPVFELCPGDSKHLEGFAFDFDRAIFLPLLPPSHSPYLMTLFWALCLKNWSKIDEELEFLMQCEPAEHAYLRALNAAFAREIGREHIDWMSKRFFGGRALPGTHYWGGGQSPETAPDWISGMRFLHGPSLAPFIGALPALGQALSDLALDASLAALPPKWQEFFSPLVAPFAGQLTDMPRASYRM